MSDRPESLREGDKDHIEKPLRDPRSSTSTAKHASPLPEYLSISNHHHQLPQLSASDMSYHSATSGHSPSMTQLSIGQHMPMPGFGPSPASYEHPSPSTYGMSPSRMPTHAEVASIGHVHRIENVLNQRRHLLNIPPNNINPPHPRPSQFPVRPAAILLR
jgi:hypothetical protein